MRTVGKRSICVWVRSIVYIAASCEDSQVQYLRHTLAHDSSIITTTAACCWDTWTVIQGGFRPSALHSSDGRCQFRGAKETTTNSSGTCARKEECQQIVLIVTVHLLQYHIPYRWERTLVLCRLRKHLSHPINLHKQYGILLFCRFPLCLC